MAEFYFTYGTGSQPFCGGWTVVTAVDMSEAVKIFRKAHPDRIKGLINCSSVYSEDEFQQTEMYRTSNFGVREQERLNSFVTGNPIRVIDGLKTCDCGICGRLNCVYRDRYQRLPREYYPGALNKCPLLEKENR